MQLMLLLWCRLCKNVLIEVSVKMPQRSVVWQAQLEISKLPCLRSFSKSERVNGHFPNLHITVYHINLHQEITLKMFGTGCNADLCPLTKVTRGTNMKMLATEALIRVSGFQFMKFSHDGSAMLTILNFG